MKKVLWTTSSFGKADKAPLELLNKYVEVIGNPYGRKVTTEEFVELSDSVDAVIAGVEKITHDALIQRPNIKVISRCGVGMDSLDVAACDDLGIKVFNTPNAPVDSVAELTVTLILSLLKNIVPMNNQIKTGNWNKMTGFMLSGKRVGIIGMGRIGSKVADLLSAFSVEIAYNDIEDKNNGYKFMLKDELLLWADIITIHTSMCPDGEYVIGEEELSKMKNSTFLINTSRGRFVDEDALYVALSTNSIAGAALDVFSEEPYEGRLTELDNVILTPHISSSAKEGRAKMEMEAAVNVLKGLGIEL